MHVEVVELDTNNSSKIDDIVFQVSKSLREADGVPTAEKF